MTKLQCTICGGAMVMDFEGEFATCESCGMKFDKRTIKSIVEGIQGYDDLVKNAEVFLELNEYGKAREIFTEITNKYPDMARGWWGLYECGTDGLVALDRLGIVQKYYDRALKFASDEERTKFALLYESYKKEQETLDLKRLQVRKGEAQPSLIREVYNIELSLLRNKSNWYENWNSLTLCDYCGKGKPNTYNDVCVHCISGKYIFV